MKKSAMMFDFLKRGGAAAGKLSETLMKNPAFVAAVATAYRGKERLDDAAGEALRRLNVPTRTEFKRAMARIDALERELADRKRETAPGPAKRRAPARGKKKAPPTGGA